MITVIRRGMKGSLFKAMLWGVVAIFVITLITPSLLQKVRVSRGAVGSVNGRDLNYLDFARKANHFEYQIRLMKDQLRSQYGELNDIHLQLFGLNIDPRLLAVNNLVLQELLNDAADKLNIMIHEQVLHEYLRNIQFIQQELSDLIPVHVLRRDGAIDLNVLRNYLQRIGLTMQDFEARVEQAVKRSNLMQLVQLGQHTLQSEVRDAFIQQYLGKRYTILTFSEDVFIANARKKGATAEEIKAFYDVQNQQSKRYWIPQKRAGTVWTFNPNKYGIIITDAQIEEYYNTYKTKLFLAAPTQVQVRTILFKAADESGMQDAYNEAQIIRAQLLQEPDTFQRVAREVSQDKETASKGGLMPFFSRGEKEPVFERSALLLQQDGDISEIIRTSRGLEILQRVSKKKQSYKALSEVKDEIKQALFEKAFANTFKQDASHMISIVHKDKAAWQKFIAEKKGKEKKTGLIEDHEGAPAQELFSLTNVGDYGYYITETEAAIVRLNDIQKSHEPQFDAVKQTVETDLFVERAQKKMAETLDEVKQMARTESLSKVQKEFGGTIAQTKWVTAENEGSQELLKKYQIPTQRLFQLEKAGALLGGRSPQGAYIVRLDEIAAFDEELFAQKADELKKQLDQQKVELVERGFIASLHRIATIKTDDSVLYTP